MFSLGIISDEVSDDLALSCSLIRDWGLSYVELRSLWGKNLLELSEGEVKEARRIIQEHNLTVSAIASPVFKASLSGKAREVQADYALSGADDFGEQLRLLERACELCRRFHTDKLRVFSFYRESWGEDVVRQIAERLLEGAKLAKARGVLLVVENESVCNAQTGRDLGELFNAILGSGDENATALAVLWDPGNARFSGEAFPYPEGYAALDKARIRHVHLKDVRFEHGQPVCVPLGQGEVDYLGQLRALWADGYRGPLILEPHYHPEGVARQEAAKACVEAAQRVLQEAFER